MIDAEVLLRSVVGEALWTLGASPRQNTVLEVRDGNALVATSRSARGRQVLIAWVQELLDRLAAGESVSLDPSSTRYRSSFLAAIVKTLPQVRVSSGSPPVASLDPDAPATHEVLAELEHRLRMWVSLRERGGPDRVEPSLVREIGMYGGASGMWTDARRTRGIGDSPSVAVGMLHTGRHYADDLSDAALLYHYPQTNRPRGRDDSDYCVASGVEVRVPMVGVSRHRNGLATYWKHYGDRDGALEAEGLVEASRAWD
jgi:hypothetical protein